MFLSVIFTTYNAPDWLEKVLLGYARQSHQDFEILVADDGSKPETAERIDALRTQTGLNIRHIWQEDDGFQKCRILNKAILHARGEYLIFSDGDCIPRQDFLAVHAARAQRGYYLSGGYYKLPMLTSEAIGPEDISSGRCFEVDWLRAHGLPKSHKELKLTSGPRLARWLNRLTPTRCNFKGANGSAWLSDVLAINGFDERMRYGGLDREFGVRLQNIGVRPRHVRYDAIVLHLDHPRGYRKPEEVAQNLALRKASEKERIHRTPQGIAELLQEGYPLPAGSRAAQLL